MATRRRETTGWPLRVYVDTSVFGGVHDVEFRAASERFFAAVRGGAFVILVSEPLVLEIERAPAPGQATFESHRDQMEAVELSEEAVALAEAYLRRAWCPRHGASTRSMSRSPRSRGPARS